MPSYNFVLIPRDSEDIAEKLARLAVFIFPLSSTSVLKVPPRQNTCVIVDVPDKIIFKVKTTPPQAHLSLYPFSNPFSIINSLLLSFIAVF